MGMCGKMDKTGMGSNSNQLSLLQQFLTRYHIPATIIHIEAPVDATSSGKQLLFLICHNAQAGKDPFIHN
jgi:hypothetical protein